MGKQRLYGHDTKIQRLHILVMYSTGQGNTTAKEWLGQILKLNIGPGKFMVDLVKSEPLPFFRANGVEQLSILLERTVLRSS